MRDIRYAFRMLLRNFGFTLAAVTCLGLGIGATTAIFSVLNAVVLKPLPYRDPQQLVRTYTEFPTFPNGGLRRFWTSPPEWLDLRRDLKSFETLDAWAVSGVNVGGGAEPVRVTSANVTGNLMGTLGISPIKGRVINSQDDAPQSPPTAVISYGLWRRVFGADPNILSRDVKINGQTTQIIGVMPDGFSFPPGEVDPPEVWTPMQINPASPGGRGSHFLYLLGRLKSNTTFATAQLEMRQYVTTKTPEGGPGNHNFHEKLHPLIMSSLHEEVTGAVRPAMFTLLGAVGFVLLIACVNVANLLLARAESRQKEIGIRTAMGASTWSLLRQFILEGLILSLAGAVFGLVLAFGGLRLIVDLNAGSIPRSQEIGLDARVLLFALGISVLTGVFFGLAPFLHRLARSVSETLRSATGRNTATVEANRLRAVMVAAELALALVLLIGSGLMIRAFVKLQSVNIGMNPDNLLTLRIVLPNAAYPAERVPQLWDQILGRINSLPGVQAATFVSGMPPIRPLNANDTRIEGYVRKEGGPPQNIDYYQRVGTKFLETTGARLIEGRFLDERDTAQANPAVVVNQTLVRTFYGNDSPIGRRLGIGPRDAPMFTIVGVVADIKNAGVDRPPGTELFLAYPQAGANATRGGFVFIRTAGDPKLLINTVRSEIASIDSTLPVAQVRTFEDVLNSANARPRFLTVLLTLFSSVALILAAVGIYGVMSYVVAQRTSEFGLRMAIGAQQSDVLWLVVRQGLTLGLVGVAAGAIGAALLTRFLQRFLFGIDALDPVTFVATAMGLTAIILFACWLPARRATQVDPMTALRYE